MDWTRGHTLGRGSTAAVYIAEACRSGEVFAVKSAELHRSEMLKREQRILSTLRSPQIVAYQGCDVTFENGDHWYNLFMEYAPHGTLAEAVHGGGMEEDVAGSYTRQILLGLNYLHSNGIVHCDVKGQNVLVTDQGAKIADLGCARRVDDESSSVIAGTPVFMAPEVARGEQQGFPADVWALGCTVLEMITGKPPWQGVSDPAAVLYRIGFSGEVPEIPSFVSEQGKDFLSKCLKRDPNERWSVVELLGHGFVEECKELSLSDSDTPTSVLERGFWDSLERTQHPTRDECSWDSPSPSDRILRLFGAEPIWEWDDDDDDQWVTVRSNELEGLSIEQTQDPGSDTICILRDQENGLVTFYESKFVVTTILVELSRWNAIIDDCYLGGSNYGCNCRKSLLVWPCPKIVPHWKFDSYNTRIFYHASLSALSFPL
ncbi:mitogen-activated protein kinase kinase kinase 18-like [Gastrolobium bilobum]|uniref:mitogen-activated protein kinase kinase kinase 18-like n=1 Tax=Gastrolobium bilobum TaxID=150636 RepID=UPI002AB0669A|nr:mitogen-activated protein kinase kinase kinase 18-like [Gastrolobium bilobum]